MIVFLGGPLLDIIAYADKTYLDKYNLKPDETIRATSDLQVIFKEILEFNPIIQPGGSVTNTARILQWISQKAYPIVFTGAIGTDEYGKIIKNKFLEEEIHTHLLEIEGIRTGICAVLLTEEKRTMVSDLGASKYMNIARLNEKLWKHLYKAEYFYMSGFFLGVCIDLVRSIFHHFKDKHKKIILNMAASFLSEKYPKQLTYLFENADIVFGNEAEYKAFSNIHNLKPDHPGNMLLKLNKLFDCNPARLLVMTRGHKPLYILHNSKVEIFETMPIRKEIIVDTDGAGDAFVGGFLAQYLQNKNLDDCVKCGTWAAREIIQHHGCNFDKNKIYNSSMSSYFRQK